MGRTAQIRGWDDYYLAGRALPGLPQGGGEARLAEVLKSIGLVKS